MAFLLIIEEVTLIQIESIVLINVQPPNQTDEEINYSIEELASLAHTAGGTVTETFSQNRLKPHPVTYVGSGKLAEIEAYINENDIDLAIVNDELSPSQLRNLHDAFEIRCIDRSQLILDIFAKRAHTKEGKLQVELAQLQYTLPRLYGMGLKLSRLGGGIGTRGPGETKLETDQRHIRRRIDDIRRRLKEVTKQRDQYRARRKENYKTQIAFIGYTNAGKSTLFNQLTDADSLEENLLFATLDPLTRKVTLPSHLECLMTDTVGFIQDLPTTLIAAFRSTLEEVLEADLLIHVIDASHPNYEKHQQTVLDLLNELGAEEIPILTVFNKKDKLDATFVSNTSPSALISAFDAADLTKLLLKIQDTLQADWDYYKVNLPVEAGKLLHLLEKNSILLEQKYDADHNQYTVKGYIKENHPLKGQIKEQ